MTTPIAQEASPVNDCKSSAASLAASLLNGHIPEGEGVEFPAESGAF